jgi:opacity protein-like surface antigen
MIMPRILLFAALAALLLPSPAALADDTVDLKSAKYEYSLLSGYGITHRGFGDTRTQVQTFDSIGRFGWFLSKELGSGWYKGRHQLLVELPVHLVVDPRVSPMVGGYLLGSWKFTSLENWAPYVFAGGGILYVDLGLPTMGSRLDFSYQGGTGVQYFIRKDLALSLEYRYHHISNAGTATPNEPLNSSKILLGVSVFR